MPMLPACLIVLCLLGPSTSRLSAERKHAALLRKAHDTPGFVVAFKSALGGYWEQAQLAQGAAQTLRDRGNVFR